MFRHHVEPGSRREALGSPGSAEVNERLAKALERRGNTAAPYADLRKVTPDPVPALLISGLAVDEDVAGLGVGAAMVRSLFATAVELNLTTA